MVTNVIGEAVESVGEDKPLEAGGPVRALEGLDDYVAAKIDVPLAPAAPQDEAPDWPTPSSSLEPDPPPRTRGGASAATGRGRQVVGCVALVLLLGVLAVVIGLQVAERPAPIPTPPPVPPWRLALDAYALRPIPGGEVTVGSASGSAGHEADERRRTYSLSPYELGATEVPQRLYQEVMGVNPAASGRRIWNGKTTDDLCRDHGLRPDYPAHCMSWRDAVRFCIRLSELAGLTPAYRVSGAEVLWDRTADGYRLPTEAEWENAASEGGHFRYAGTNDLSSACVFSNVSNAATKALFPTRKPFPCNDGQAGVARVASRSATSFGLYDQTGNVWEWTWNWYSPRHAADHTGPDSGDRKAIRGSAWHSETTDARIPNRYYDGPDDTSYWVGLRLARNAPGTTP